MRFFCIYRPAARFIRWSTILRPPVATIVTVANLNPCQKPSEATCCNSSDRVSGRVRNPELERTTDEDEPDSAYTTPPNRRAIVRSLHNIFNPLEFLQIHSLPGFNTVYPGSITDFTFLIRILLESKIHFRNLWKTGTLFYR